MVPHQVLIKFWHVFILGIFYSWRPCSGFNFEFTVEVLAGKVECFYQPVRQVGDVIEIDYQVIDGGETDIDFSVRDPSGVVILRENRLSEGTHEIPIAAEGDYVFCFDNSFSILSSKTVYFELFSEEPDSSELSKRKELVDLYDNQEEASRMYDMAVSEIKHSLDLVKSNLEKIVSDQHNIRTTNRKDRTVQEHNYERVNYFSAFQLVVMVSLGAFQVYMIRMLFSSRLGGNGPMKAST